MFAIVNKRNGKFLVGTNFRYSPPRLILSDSTVRIFEYGFQAVHDFKQLARRLSNKGADYEIVKIKIDILHKAFPEELDD